MKLLAQEFPRHDFTLLVSYLPLEFYKLRSYTRLQSVCRHSHERIHGSS